VTLIVINECATTLADDTHYPDMPLIIAREFNIHMRRNARLACLYAIESSA